MAKRVGGEGPGGLVFADGDGTALDPASTLPCRCPISEARRRGGAWHVRPVSGGYSGDRPTGRKADSHAERIVCNPRSRLDSEGSLVRR